MFVVCCLLCVVCCVVARGSLSVVRRPLFGVRLSCFFSDVLFVVC